MLPAATEDDLAAEGAIFKLPCPAAGAGAGGLVLLSPDTGDAGGLWPEAAGASAAASHSCSESIWVAIASAEADAKGAETMAGERRREAGDARAARSPSRKRRSSKSFEGSGKGICR